MLKKWVVIPAKAGIQFLDPRVKPEDDTESGKVRNS